MNKIPNGQMTTDEREYIAYVVKNIDAKLCLESGTWYGGGSTLSIVKALVETDGILHTFEEYEKFFLIAKQYYDNSEYVNNIKLYNMSFIQGLYNFSNDFLKSVDFILLDGGDELPNGHHKLPVSSYIQDYNLSENVRSFQYLESKIKTGCSILLHDWIIDTGRGNFVKRYLEETNNQNFKLINIIHGSTGLAHIKKVQ